MTFKRERDSYLYIIVNMDGKEINRIFLKEGEANTIKDGFYYWLEFSEEKEEYILHRLKI